MNSINWARILAQIVYYVYAYFRAKEQGVAEVAFAVPTGNFGDILAGFYAKKLGVPLGKLVVATNENDILHRFFSTGKYHRHAIEHTSSPSMDICVSSNFERYLFALSGENAAVLSDWMRAFEQTGQLTLDGELLAQAQRDMASYAVLQPDVEALIRRYHKVHQYLFDPHSAIGAGAAERFGEQHLASTPNAAVVVVGTAHYGKFLPVVSKALGVPERDVQQHPLLQALETLPTRRVVATNSSAAVAQLVRANALRKRRQHAPFWCTQPASTYAATALVVAAAAAAAAFFVAKRK